MLAEVEESAAVGKFAESGAGSSVGISVAVVWAQSPQLSETK